MTMTGVLGGMGTLVGLVRALPQLLRLARQRDSHGVSLDTAATSSIVSFGWATYGVWTDQPPVALATGASGVVFAGVAVLAVRYGRRASELRTAPVWLLVLVVSAAVKGSTGLGLLLPISVLVANVPQMIAVFRERDLSGLSAATWALSATDGLVWGTYAVVADDRPILVFGLLQFVTSMIIVVRRWLWSRTGSAVLDDRGAQQR